jgi:hypothetical protein
LYSDLAITALAVIWLQRTAKQSEEAEGDLFLRKGSLAMLPALTDGSTNRPHGLPSRCSAKFGETDP